MPHSEITSPTMSPPQVNGDSTSPSSAFLSHLFSYPLISDTVSTIKDNPYGKRSLDLTSEGYEKFASPLLSYFAKPYQYVSPYVKKADSIGDNTLSTIDSKFPIVKKPTGELYSDGKSIVFFPLKKGSEGKDYVFSTYNTEVKKVGGEGIVTYGKAAVSTGLIVSTEALSWLGDFLKGKKAEAKEVSNEKFNN